MHLLDVNVWLALAFKRHTHHAPAADWFRTASARCIFCRFTQASFLRLASNPSAMGAAAVTMSDAWRAYDAFIADPNVAFADEPDGIETIWRSNTQNATFSPKVWNDAYLAAFAQLAGFEVVTFDRGFTNYSSIRALILP
jgi:toxin-antitoxin system PIN domain toxin